MLKVLKQHPVRVPCLKILYTAVDASLEVPEPGADRKPLFDKILIANRYICPCFMSNYNAKKLTEVK